MWEFFGTSSMSPGLDVTAITITAIALISLIGCHWPRLLPGIPVEMSRLITDSSPIPGLL